MFLIRLGVLALVINVACGRVACGSEVTADRRPNVLFIAVDDLNDWVGCLGGHPQAETPNIDELARRGMLFSNAHCAAPACTPSRASLFTGQMPQNTGVWSNDGPKLNRLRRDPFLLPDSFSRSGYRTLGTGKLGPNKSCFQKFYSVHQRWSPLSSEAVEYTPGELLSKGSDNPRHVVTVRNQQYVLPLNRMPSDRTPEDPKGESFDWGPFDVPDNDFGDTQITNWAIKQLRAGSTKPLFLAVGYYRPHQPLWAPRRFFDRFVNDPAVLPAVLEDDLDDLGKSARKWAVEPVTSGMHKTVRRFQQWRAAVEGYLACVSYVDHEIGRLLAALDESAMAENTLIVLWSDHGWHLGEKQHWGKWTGWERSTRVPLIVVPPRSSQKTLSASGQRCDRPVNLIDLYPTLIQFCGLENPPHKLDGQSLVPLLEKPDSTAERSSITMFGKGNASLRTDRWRFIRYADGSEELYDLSRDPREWVNLAGNSAYSERTAVLRSKMAPFLLDPAKK
jgi:arylsulfatase A-like enzyme